MTRIHILAQVPPLCMHAGSCAGCWLDGDTSADAAFAAKYDWSHLLPFVNASFEFEPTLKAGQQTVLAQILSHKSAIEPLWSLGISRCGRSLKLASGPTPLTALEAG